MATAAPTSPARHLAELTLDFIAYLELERGLSRNTLEAYRSDLQQYGLFLEARAIDPLAVGGSRARATSSPSSPSAPMAGAPVAPATLGRKIACLRSFYRHLRREGILSEDPTGELRPPRSRAKLPQVLSRDEVTLLLAQPRGAAPPALRDRALLETMYACGLRASEATGLELSHLDLEAGILRTHGKGAKERLVPIGRQAVEALQDYLDAGRPSLVGLRDEPRVFLNQRGGGLTRQGLYKIVQRHARTRRARAPDEPAHPPSYVRHAPAGRRL